ncbi:MAG: S8 family peptidase [Betaproteobacteria bacterium]
MRSLLRRIPRISLFGLALFLCAGTAPAGPLVPDVVIPDGYGTRIAVMVRNAAAMPAAQQQARVNAAAQMLGPDAQVIARGDGRFDIELAQPRAAVPLREAAARLGTIPDLLWSVPQFPVDEGAQAAKTLAARERSVQVPTSVIVRFKDFNSQLKAATNKAPADEKLARASQAAGIGLKHQRAMSGRSHVLQLDRRLTHREYEAMLARLATHDDIELVSGNWRDQATAVIPNDTYFSKQWNLLGPSDGYYGIDAVRAWTLSTGSASTIVSVVDTGIRPHTELYDRIIGGYDFIAMEDNGLDPGDYTKDGECGEGEKGTKSGWHGTHVSGTIAADSNNSQGISGIDWKAQILPVRVLGPCGGYRSDIQDGLTWAAGAPVPGIPQNMFPAKVINMSLGGPGKCDLSYQEAINRAVAQGAFIAVAAGNENDNSDDYSPASCLGVMTVAATGPGGDTTPYSNYSFRLEISAPGGDSENYGSSGSIYSTVNSGLTSPEFSDYGYKQGTSMASPHVAGVASLMLGINPALSPGEIYYLLQDTALPFPSGTWCRTSGKCGAGIVSASRASLQALAYKPYRLVYEFKNTVLNHYFRTAAGEEARAVETGAAGVGWYDTLDYYYAWASQAFGTVPVCRFYGTPGRGPNSHFYTANANECQIVKQDPGWTYEGIAFYAAPVTAQGCPGGTRPVLRSYNNRAALNDTNHRFTTSAATQQAMIAQGWISEGPVFCVI